MMILIKLITNRMINQIMPTNNVNNFLQQQIKLNNKKNN